jgi:hypothetical protein
MEVAAGRTKNLRRHPVLGYSIKIIILTRRAISQRKNGMEFPKVGRGWGENNKRKKKGSRYFSVTP